VQDRRRKNEPRQPERRSSNRRAFPRWELPFEVRYGNGPELSPGQGIEISESGMAFTGDMPYDVGTEIDLRYRLNPEDEWVRVRAVVRHIEGNIVFGVEFLNLRLPDRLNILDYVSAKS
jgi:hypothetical protein